MGMTVSMPRVLFLSLWAGLVMGALAGPSRADCLTGCDPKACLQCAPGTGGCVSKCIEGQCCNNGACRQTGTDTDGDGADDCTDNCPEVANGAQADADADGAGDACDDDDDGDGVPDDEDNCPAVPNSAQSDCDSDGTGDSCDEEPDTDGDGVADACDDDDDGDAVLDEQDNCPTSPNAGQEDTDGDGQGNACDDDVDGDGISNGEDDDVDGDGVPNGLDDDVDGDGIPNGEDSDADGDGLSNGEDEDVDGDGVPNAADEDVDGDGIPNGEDTDVDGDGVPNGEDSDVDGDQVPNGADGDIDGDGAPNGEDPDADGDGSPNGEDPDVDGDGVPNGQDSDVDGDQIPNGEDSDVDGDGVSNGADEDVDGDSSANGQDEDVDGDGSPNGQDDDVDGDGVSNGEDGDIDGDGTPNAQDDDMDGDGLTNGQDDDDDGDGVPDSDDSEPGGGSGVAGGGSCQWNSFFLVQFKTFIAADVIETAPSPLLYDFMKGDLRGFSQIAGQNRCRTFQMINLKLAPNGGAVGGATTVIGTSTGYDDDPDGSDVWPTGNTACSGLFAYNLLSGATADCTQTGTGTLQISTPSIELEGSYTIISVGFNVSSGPGCLTGSPDIDAEITLEIRQKCENGSLKRPEFRLTGQHDGFPWYELWVEKVPVYLYNPCTNNQGPNSLFWPMEWEIQDSCPSCVDWSPLYP